MTVTLNRFQTVLISIIFGGLLSICVTVLHAGNAAAYTYISGEAYFGSGSIGGDGDDPITDVIDARRFGSNAIPAYVYDGTANYDGDGNGVRNGNKDDFLYWLDTHLVVGGCASTHNQVGAAFIVNTMLGRSTASPTKCISNADWQELKWRVMNPDITMFVNTIDPNTLTGVTSFYSPASNDNFFHYWNASSRLVIYFRQISTGQNKYFIEVPCANPLGILPLPVRRQPAVVYAGSDCTTKRVWGSSEDPDNPTAKVVVRLYIENTPGVWSIAGTTTANLGGTGNGYEFNTGNVSSVYWNGIVANGKRMFVRAYGVSYTGAQDGLNKDTAIFSLGPCNTGSCLSHTFPGTMVVGRSYSFTVGTRIAVWGSGYTTSNPAMKVQVKNPDGTLSVNSPTVSYTRSGSAPADLTSVNVTFTPNQRGTYQMQWGVTGYGMNIQCRAGNDGNWSNPVTGDAGDQPYVSVIGGDVISGAGVFGFNEDGGTYAGAGTQLGVIATSPNPISGFVSGKGLFAPPVPPSYNGANLSFANNSGVGGGNYGGNFTATPPATTIPSLTPTGAFGGGDISGLASGVYTVPNGASIYGTVGAGKEVTLLVNGTVFISGNIGYSYGTLNDVPRLNIYSNGGDIIVRGSVTEIHGVFIAQKNGAGVGGNFYTCGINAGLPVTYALAGTYYNDCRSNLSIFGAIVADKIIFTRNSGTWAPGQPNTTPSETIVYSAEVWLHDMYGATSGSTNGGPSFGSYVSLPPVL